MDMKHVSIVGTWTGISLLGRIALIGLMFFLVFLQHLSPKGQGEGRGEDFEGGEGLANFIFFISFHKLKYNNRI